LEIDLSIWILERVAKHHVTTHEDIIEEALRIAEKEGITNFKASPGWLKKFKKRYRFTYRTVTHTSRKTEFSEADKVKMLLID
jgi:hypothetical protein